MLVAVEGEVLLGLLVLVADDAVGRGELGHHQAAAAEVADEAAEDRVGDAGHGRQHGRGTNFDATERDGRGHARARGRDPFGRIVEKLVHDEIVTKPPSRGLRSIGECKSPRRSGGSYSNSCKR